MKDKVPIYVESGRITKGLLASMPEFGFNGKFSLECEGVILSVVVSDQRRWDHVSVSLPHRCPSWKEMCYIKSLFFKPTETVIQYHPKESSYINEHPFCLHLWRPQKKKIPTPPLWMI